MKKKAAVTLIWILCVPLFTLGLISLLDKDPTKSELENRMLKTKPEITLDAFFSGTYMGEFSEYYADTFPFRESLMAANMSMNRFYYFQGNGQEGGMVILEHAPNDGQGETIIDLQPEHADTPAMTSPVPKPLPSSTPELSPTPIPTAPPTTAVFPDKSEAQEAGNVVVFGTRAMEIAYANSTVMTRYVTAVNELDAAMPETQTLLMVAPNSAEFYSSADMHTGATSQLKMIDTIYEQTSSAVDTIDAYSKLQSHTDEYIYFRTDHHWTALGAYYAYMAFCETMGLEAIPLESFETGVYEDFLGSMYKFTAKYPVSKVLQDNPDTLTYYFPRVDTAMTIYTDGAAMEKPMTYPVINTKLGDYSNKYICFIGGDNELTHIETSMKNGKSILIVKESFGNAMVPFLTSHYQDIWVIDPRKLNGKDQPAFNLSEFVAQQEIDQVLFINYPFMVINKAYCSYLENLR